MVDVNKELMNLYEDAYYCHLIHNGYTVRKAMFYAKGKLV